MKAVRWLLSVVGLLGVGVGAIPSDCLAQGGRLQSGSTTNVVIGIYHVAPGRHLDFLRYMVESEATTKEAGLPAAQWYAHVDGDSWDYLMIAPATTPEQDAKADAVARQHGRATGAPAGIQLRQFISSHTDTFARGPMNVAELLAAATQK